MTFVLEVYPAEEDSKQDMLSLWNMMPESSKRYYNNCIETYTLHKHRQDVDNQEDRS